MIDIDRAYPKKNKSFIRYSKSLLKVIQNNINNSEMDVSNLINLRRLYKDERYDIRIERAKNSVKVWERKFKNCNDTIEKYCYVVNDNIYDEFLSRKLIDDEGERIG